MSYTHGNKQYLLSLMETFIDMPESRVHRQQKLYSAFFEVFMLANKKYDMGLKDDDALGIMLEGRIRGGY
ncbi:hypothetical protein P3T76_013666 [Phytophthora citrophthora]|uniref:Uncharacterized protein n=1 Tax=Phytophthora citrophthora TaxID=4793 RepID=A0AAD9G2B9_9STRA|nr:hypothetical protein P3T76_013666 [Phytophthora citrophthora]